MSRMIYCQSCEKMEIMVETTKSGVEFVTLNEQRNGPHHLAVQDPLLFCHSGSLLDCEPCTTWAREQKK